MLSWKSVMGTDHPRGCGEHRHHICRTCRRPGSSPRMRGALVGLISKHSGGRIIPADAGSTVNNDQGRVADQDHPRGCGEHARRARRATQRRGSSPRMRGARCPRPASRATTRIIPADAGSTGCELAVSERIEDHPRGCGEHGEAVGHSATQEGSSPRMRGAPVLTTLTVLHKVDHPRGCGEHARPWCPKQVEQGSSPRMRGARITWSRPRVESRIIPADAGSTIFGVIGVAQTTDHPRGCGEHLQIMTVARPLEGSSPRMRGAQRHDVLEWIKSRIIPADAGSTSQTRIFHRMRRGSSPRMRGAHFAWITKMIAMGIIPADAGSTL